MNNTDSSSEVPSTTTIISGPEHPQGPVPAPCPPGGGHSPTRPSSSAVSVEIADGRSGGSHSYTATYSVDDNKLRLYALRRLDSETFARVKAAGFKWAPKQDLFVAPMWTPAREDLMIELAGEIDDEDTSLTERAGGRAERFEGYSERRATDAEHARQAVDAIAENIPFGQPILVGHHSERHARRDAAKIENGMRRAVQMWRTSEYWTRRAAGAIRHAKYKELPPVRARRIKTIEADKRKHERDQAKATHLLALWRIVHDDSSVRMRDGSPTTFAERALYLADRSLASNLWSDLKNERITPADAQAQSIKGYDSSIAWHRRWIVHFDNRLTYERAMLNASGYTPPPKPKTKADLPLLNYSGEVAYRNPWKRGDVTRTEAVGMTKAELARLHTDSKGTRVSECGTHRVRVAMYRRGGSLSLVAVFLTDSKQHPRPSADEVEVQAAADESVALAQADQQARERATRAAGSAAARAEKDAKAAPFLALAESLKTGVQVVAAPQLFPTPPDLAQRMVELAGVRQGETVLEPSAGTGAIVRAIAAAVPLHLLSLHAIEVNTQLAGALQAGNPDANVHAADFLSYRPGDLEADRILMNPPFIHGEDVRHIRHALAFLRPGGRLVGICANGPRQRAELKPLVEERGGLWEDLPADTFKSVGTSVRAALIVLPSLEA